MNNYKRRPKVGDPNDHDLLIILNSKMDHVLRVLEEFPAHGSRLGALETANAVKSTQIDTICEEVEKLRSTNTVWSVINSVGVGLSGLIGFIK